MHLWLFSPLGFPKSTGNRIFVASLLWKFKINNRSCLLIVFLQVSELQKELTLLAKSNQELEDKVELREPAHMEEISELEVRTAWMQWWMTGPDRSSQPLNAPSTCFAVRYRWNEAAGGQIMDAEEATWSPQALLDEEMVKSGLDTSVLNTT